MGLLDFLKPKPNSLKLFNARSFCETQEAKGDPCLSVDLLNEIVGLLKAIKPNPFTGGINTYVGDSRYEFVVKREGTLDEALQELALVIGTAAERNAALRTFPDDYGVSLMLGRGQCFRISPRPNDVFAFYLGSRE